MRVACHAGQLLQPVPGGIGLYITAVLSRLPGVGVEPIAFAAGPRPRTVPPGVPWVDLGWPNGSLRYELWHRLRRPYVRIDADVVHAPSLAVPPVRDTPLVVTVHDIAFIRIPGVTTRRGTSFHRRGLEHARRHADLVLTPSSFTRLELIREGFAGDDVVVVPLGVSPPLPREPVELDAALARLGVTEPFVLTVGTIEPRKDLPTIVAAVERVRRTRSSLELVIVGPKGWGDVRGLERHGVRVMGELPWRDVDALYRRASACCVASRYEGFGLPAVEALARETPVIVAENSAMPEVVDDAGLRFPTGDSEALAARLEQVFDDAALQQDLARRGMARAAQLTWESSAALHAQAFTLAVDRHRRRR